MSYELAFLDEALKEWRRLDRPTREQFKAKLAERLAAPRVPAKITAFIAHLRAFWPD